jgi:RNA polymerase sigma-70 factor (sigma-E family)
MHEESRSGDGDPAFRDYVLARGTALLRMAVVLTGNRADAEDLVQAALAKTYLAWGKINDRAATDAYVRRAMVNTHISWWRHRKLEEFPTDELPDQVVADHARDSDVAEVVRRALDRLPRRMRAAVMLRYFEDMTEPEIAAALGISLGTVKSTVSRAVARLRIDEELGEEPDLLGQGRVYRDWRRHCRLVGLLRRAELVALSSMQVRHGGNPEEVALCAAR